MKTLVAPLVLEKTQTLDAVSKQELSRFLGRAADPSQFAVLRRKSNVLDPSNGIYVISTGILRIFYTIGEKEGDPYVLVLDLASAMASPRVNNPDPRIDSNRNPYVNSTINPYLNSALNPFLNSNLNPYLNSDLNPYINAHLNPFLNARLNPYLNSSINPAINSRINPAINSAVNPFLNPNFDGMRFYDLNLLPDGFAIKSDEIIIIYFDQKMHFGGIGILNSVSGYTLFDAKSEWIGYLVPDGQGGYLNFDLNQGWCGIVTR